MTARSVESSELRYSTLIIGTFTPAHCPSLRMDSTPAKGRLIHVST